MGGWLVRCVDGRVKGLYVATLHSFCQQPILCTACDMYMGANARQVLISVIT